MPSQTPAAPVHPCARGTRTSMCIVGVDPTAACSNVGEYGDAARLEPTCHAKQKFATLFRLPHLEDRKSVVSGKSVSVRVGLGGRRNSTKQNYGSRHVISQCSRHDTTTLERK